MKKYLFAGVAVGTLAASQALAADLPVKAPYLKAPPPVFTWTGCYIGGNAGGKDAWHRGSVTSAAAVGPAGASPAGTVVFSRESTSTLIGGGQIGCNYQTGPWVLGVEADADAQRWRENRALTGVPGFPFIAGDTFSLRSRWEASVRGRLGYAWDRTMLYITGGVAFTDVEAGVNFIPVGIFPADVFNERKTRAGGTIGAGLEYAFTDNWSLGVEGRYSFYGTQTFSGSTLATVAVAGPTFTFAPVTQSIKLSTAEAMVKLNYRFNWAGPVSTRY